MSFSIVFLLIELNAKLWIFNSIILVMWFLVWNISLPNLNSFLNIYSMNCFEYYFSIVLLWIQWSIDCWLLFLFYCFHFDLAHLNFKEKRISFVPGSHKLEYSRLSWMNVQVPGVLKWNELKCELNLIDLVLFLSFPNITLCNKTKTPNEKYKSNKQEHFGPGHRTMGN